MVPSLYHVFRGADFQEREVYDMMGVRFAGHPELKRILMWDGYPYHPLRKEFPLAGIETPLPDAEVSEETGTKVIPEFKEPAAPSRWEFVKVVTGAEMAWGYTKQTIDVTAKDGKHVGYLVWSAYVLQKAGSTWKVVLLDWSVRRLGPAD